ncbi:MAG: MarR family transcriptional regulator [Rhizobiales bacterium 62-47]|nr:MarR family transcriptional regulator [Hyphomicrobiales bacterium]OJY09270.1 MAG: MarR family transcriptional regulator [Rhizobiales bacterium 62-47]
MTPDPPVSPLETHLGFWLRYVSNQVSHAFAQRLEQRGITVAEWVVLRELFDGDMIPSALAERLGMTRGGISKLADRLTAKALIARRPNGDDRRYQALALSSAGKALVPELARIADDNDAEFFAHLTPDQRNTIEFVMRDIVERRGMRPVPTA